MIGFRIVAPSDLPTACRPDRYTNNRMVGIIRAFHALLRIEECEFLVATHATIKLATRFQDWRPGESFLHAFEPDGSTSSMS